MVLEKSASSGIFMEVFKIFSIEKAANKHGVQPTCRWINSMHKSPIIKVLVSVAIVAHCCRWINKILFAIWQNNSDSIFECYHVYTLCDHKTYVSLWEGNPTCTPKLEGWYATLIVPLKIKFDSETTAII